MPNSITASVGIHGKNIPADTLTIQNLLNSTAAKDGGADHSLDPDGKCGPKTCNAIQKFQLTQFGWSGADGRVDPNGATLIALNVLNPDVGSPQTPAAQPAPEPLSTSFQFWLRHNPKFFSHPYAPDEFVFTVVDFTNSRMASYGLQFNGKVGVKPPDTGSGGHTAKITLNKPTTISGLGGQAVYQTLLKHGSGPAADRLVSKMVVFIENGKGFSAKFDCHILKPVPGGATASGANDPAATIQPSDEGFAYNLNGFLVKIS